MSGQQDLFEGLMKKLEPEKIVVKKERKTKEIGKQLDLFREDKPKNNSPWPDRSHLKLYFIVFNEDYKNNWWGSDYDPLTFNTREFFEECYKRTRKTNDFWKSTGISWQVSRCTDLSKWKIGYWVYDKDEMPMVFTFLTMMLSVMGITGSYFLWEQHKYKNKK